MRNGYERIVSLLLIFAMVLCFAACGEPVEQQPDNPVSEASSAATSEPTDPTEPSDPAEPSSPSDSDPENTPDDPADFVPGTDDNTDDAQIQDFSIVGTWIANGSNYKGKEYYVFNDDGTSEYYHHPGGSYIGYSSTFELIGNELYILS